MDHEGHAIEVAIVEDDKDLVRLYVKLLEKRGLKVGFIAYNGIEALDRLRSSNPKPAIILMDHRMPAMTGVEVTREMHSISPGSKIIFLSADADAREDAMNAGAIAFLKKPAPLKVIIETIRSALP